MRPLTQYSYITLFKFFIIKIFFVLFYLIFLLFPKIENNSRQLSAIIRTFRICRLLQSKNYSLETFRLKHMHAITYDFFGKKIKPLTKRNSTIYKLPYSNSNTSSCILYVHGGGFIGGTFFSYKTFCTYLLSKFKMDLYFSEYRKCPEYYIEDGIEDINDTLKEIKKEKYNSVIIISDSAGSFFSNSLIQKLSIDEKKFIKSVIFMSPVLDLKCSGESYQKNRDICIIDFETYKKVLSFIKYKFNKNTKNSYKNYPPTLIVVSSNEIFYSDSNFIYNELKNNNIPVKLISKNAFHCYPLYYSYSPEARETIDQMAHFSNNPELNPNKDPATI